MAEVITGVVGGLGVNPIACIVGIGDGPHADKTMEAKRVMASMVKSFFISFSFSTYRFFWSWGKDITLQPMDKAGLPTRWSEYLNKRSMLKNSD